MGLVDLSGNGRVLTAAERQRYERDGYIIVKHCVPQYEIQRYYKRFNDICQGKDIPVMTTVMRDISAVKSQSAADEKIVIKVQDFNTDPVLFDYCKYPTIVDVVKDLIGTPNCKLMSMHTMLINKPSDNGSLTSRHPMHQDLHYFPFRPADYIICAWTAMERVNRQNGCLVVVPGSHKSDLLDHGYPDWTNNANKAYHGIKNYDLNTPRVYVEMDAGDTVFFHPLLIHGSGANRTSGFRKAISTHYANGDKCEYISVENTNQQPAADEVVSMAQRHPARFGVPREQLTIQNIWKIRSRALNNERANM